MMLVRQGYNGALYNEELISIVIKCEQLLFCRCLNIRRGVETSSVRMYPSSQFELKFPF